jgi:type I restriction enzyme R subunit
MLEIFCSVIYNTKYNLSQSTGNIMEMKKNLSERDICTKYILPALKKAGWDIKRQVREEVTFTHGRIYVNGKRTRRGSRKRADYILYYKPNIPVAVIEAKRNEKSVGFGIQQALDYAVTLDLPVAYSSNGDGFLEHDRTASDGQLETNLSLDEFPSPQELWNRYKVHKGIQTPAQEAIATSEYFSGSGHKTPRYYQRVAVNRAVEAIAKGQNRILLVMATGTGKTYTAFQIMYRLWKSGAKKRILFLADRNALIDQAKRNDLNYFARKECLTVIKKKKIDKSYEVYMALYQGLTNYDEDADAYREFSPGFFDLVIVDECHRGSARADSAWREILEYFSSATQIGLTATPKETAEVSSSQYFGEPIYTYSLKQGIADGFLAPYKVLRVGINVDLEDWRPEEGKTDIEGGLVPDRIYNTKDFDRNLVIDERTKTVARRVTEFLRNTGRYAKTIVFCVDIEHAERMRQALVNENSDIAIRNPRYVMRITGDDPAGKMELDNFIDPEKVFPVIATTSKLMTTGIDAQTCKLIVLDSNIGSMTEFKQIIGRGTRIKEELGKTYFTIMDFRKVTDLFADPAFDGDPVSITPISGDDPISPEDIDDSTDEPIIDDNSGDEVPFENADDDILQPSPPTIEGGGSIIREPRKIYVAGVDISILNERIQYTDGDGNLITGSVKDFTRQSVRSRYRSLDHFLNAWNEADKKSTIIHELEEQGIVLEQLRGAVKKELDLFDLICHVAWDRPPLSRKERAHNVKKRDYFAKYSDKARQVIDALLDKYADEGIENIEELSVLKVDPFSGFGTPMEIIAAFGGKDKYLEALAELESEIYKVA